LRAAADRFSADPIFWARPPREDDTCVSFLPRREPELLPPPDSVFTVA
jgi:hypothetical protein